MDIPPEIPSPTIRMVPLAALRTDGGTQFRSSMHADTVADYTAAMQARTRFPPLIVYDDGEALWVADGHHRLAATQAAGLTEFPAEIRPGTLRNAVLCAAHCNAAHGLRRTSADKRHKVERLLFDEEWRRWSNREVARVAAVSLDPVNRNRAELETSQRIVRMETRTASRNGKSYTVETGKPASQGAKSASAAARVPDVAALPEAEQIDATSTLACAG